MEIIRQVSPECGIGACPAVFETDQESFVVVGRQIDQNEVVALGLESKIAPGENAVEVPKSTFRV